MAPSSSPGFLSNRLKEAAGLLCLLGMTYLFLCLLTYDALDPSLNNATPSQLIHNSGGLLGAYMADWLLMTFGISAFVPSLALGFYGTTLLRHHGLEHLTLRLATLPLMIVSIAALAAILQPFPGWPAQEGVGNGGLVGKLVAFGMLRWFGFFGTVALTGLLACLSLMWLGGITLKDVHTFCLHVKSWALVTGAILWRLAKRLKFKKSMQFDLPLAAQIKPKLRRPKPKVERPQPKPKTEKQEVEKQAALPLALSSNFELPPLTLLNDIEDKGETESEDALTQNARQIEAQLKNFNIEGVVKKVRPGPVITIYEFEPAPGVKTAAIVNLSADLARAMSAMAIRIAPIPGQNVIGIEMPNRKRRFISFKEMIASESFETNNGKLSVALGVDTGGEPVYDDIAKMPHALIAGTTGSGKSVAMNAFIASLLYRMTPEELRFVMIDPKMLELSIYNDIPHLLTPVITDPNKAATALKWVVAEMERRYKMMSELGCKNLQSFNAKLSDMLAEGDVPTRLVQVGFDVQTGQPKMEKQPLAEKTEPYIVVVIDELADLMMVAGKQVEVYIARLAQMARAAGIHLLVATQRPSVDVVTGLIKANIPTRMSFSVTSKIDSRTVLDQMGAEQLLGKGDMLFMANGANTLQRLHGAFVSEEECNAIADHLRQQGKPAYAEDMFTSPATENKGGAGTDDISSDDPVYLQAIEIIAKEQKASTSFIQRQLKIGYNRAADIIDKLEADGLIGPADHVGKREVVMRKPPEEGY